MKVLKLLHKVRLMFWKITQPTTLGVRVLLIKDNLVVLVKHSYQDKWYLPGGGVKKGETWHQAAKRELLEEGGTKVNDLALFGVYTNFKEGKHDYVVVFRSKKFTVGRDTSSLEIQSIKLFPLEKLPPNISDGSKRRILEFVEGEKTASLW